MGYADRADVTRYPEVNREDRERWSREMRIWAAHDMVIAQARLRRTRAANRTWAHAVRSAAATISLASSWMRRKWSSPRKLSA